MYISVSGSQLTVAWHGSDLLSMVRVDMKHLGDTVKEESGDPRCQPIQSDSGSTAPCHSGATAIGRRGGSDKYLQCCITAMYYVQHTG